MARGSLKRFYDQAAAAPCAEPEAGYRVLLDGRAVLTPARVEMALPTRALAEAIAAEWAAQGDTVEPRAMPLTGLAWTAIDQVAPGRARVVADIAAHGAHDLLCYRAEGPADLAARQHELWQPLLDWAAVALDAPLAVTAGVVSVAQPPAALDALRRAVAERSDMALAGLAAAVTAAGSLVIGLALCAGRIDAAAAFAAAQLDETYQSERWGEDREAARRRAAIRDDLAAAARFCALLRA